EMRKHDDMLSASIRAVVCGLFYILQNSDVIPPSEALPSFIFIFDDVACNKQDVIREYFTMDVREISKHLICDNANLLILLKQDSTNLKYVYNDHMNTDMSIIDPSKQIVENIVEPSKDPIMIDTFFSLAEMLNMSKSTIHEHFVKLGYINRFDIWIPHDLTEKNLMDRISICDSLYKRMAIEQKRPEIANRKGVINHLEKFFAEKPERFWKDGIFKLPERWRIVEQNGTYII
ncbi:hypothetical protein ALC53_05043, partial [Atta colombica]